MLGIREIVFHITAAVAVVAAVGVTAASAIEVAASSDEPVSRATAVAANEIRDALPARKVAAVPNPQRRPRTVRVRALPAPAARPAAVAYRYWDCSGSWCGRQFVLMLGIGY